MKEEEIRPKKIFDEYLRLAAEDTEKFFSDVQRNFGVCPACETIGKPTFVKNKFSYEICPKCYTLFVNPRPVVAAFERYYVNSPSSKFWASTFYKETAEARKEKLWKPKAQKVLKILGENQAVSHRIVDIGGGFGLFAEEIRSLNGNTPFVIEPGPDLAAICRRKALPVLQKFLEEVLPEDLPAGPKAFVSFELFEHLHSPAIFLQHLYNLMTKGDVLIFTTLSGCGLDILVLGQNSKSVSPPHHLNFLNPRSVSFLLSRLGFENINVSTPGKLDIDILVNNRALIEDRFWQKFIDVATDIEKATWQEVIAATGWSSHMMVTCRK